jgi:VWFA-related protein
MRRLLTGLVAVTALASLSASARPELADGRAGGQERGQIFRAGVDVVSLNVTVVDTENHYVTDLGEGDFSVFEDGTKQELTFFNRTSLPIALSILMDTSASMENRLQIAQDAAIGFTKKLRAQDLAQIVDFPTTLSSSSARFAPQWRADRRRCTTPFTFR